MKILYNAGDRPTPFDMEEGDEVYNAVDKITYTKDKWDNIQVVVNTTGIRTFKNILINGDFRINQRGFDGNWAGAPSWNIGYDRWYKHPDGYLYQLIEEGNYKPNTIYTLSGTNIVAQQVVSPTSGPWNMGAISAIGEISYTATDIQLEEGSIATSFEQIPIGETLSLCQRYYFKTLVRIGVPANGVTRYFGSPVIFPSTMRSTPSVVVSDAYYTEATDAQVTNVISSGLYFTALTTATNASSTATATLSIDAEL